MLGVVCSLRSAEYPQKHAQEAADEIATLLTQRRAELLAIPSDAGHLIVDAFCRAISSVLADLLQVVGFLQRSRLSANPFEVYDSLRRIAAALFSKTQVRVVLSTEWEFSPYTFPAASVPSLPDYVFIGLPASEAANMLLVPLIGHEMGHSLWVSERGDQQYDPAVGSKLYEAIKSRWEDVQRLFPFAGNISQLFTESSGRARIQRLASSALSQCEEILCDFLGLRLFGESYLQALAYMIAPSWPGERPLFYPSERQRAEYLVDAANKIGVSIPDRYLERFSERGAPPSPVRELHYSLVDSTAEALADSLWTHVDALVSAAKLGLPTTHQVDEIVEELTKVVPASAPSSLSAIVSAGWQVMLKQNLWTEYPQIKDRRGTLNELLLKSAQVLEINQRTVR